MQRCVIVGGAEIRNYEFVRQKLKEDDYVIFCDSGLSHMERLGVTPSLIVGDFDSHINPNMAVETIVLPCKKDDTDTVFAVKEALQRGFEEFLLLGVVGGRLDHTIANVSILVMLKEQGKTGYIVDDYSIMEMVADETVYVQDNCSFFSLLNVTGTAEGITIKNAKYPLVNGSIACNYQYGTSNEVIEGQTAEITVTNGNLLLIRVFRDSEK